jgi:hypothetical protein
MRPLRAPRAAIVAASLAAVACASHPRALRPALTTDEWAKRRASFASFRAALEPAAPYAARIRAELREPRTGHTFQARGAVAVDPGKALRMILVGPGGATTLDAWVTRDRWRFAVPPLALVRRGGTDPGAERGLPVGFFRWWFLSPLEGQLLARDPDGSPVFGVVRDGAATVEVFAAPGDRSACVAAVRRQGRAHESLASCTALGAAPREGDRATYDQLDTGLHVDIYVEGAAGAPEREAFTDPDVSEGGGS